MVLFECFKHKAPPVKTSSSGIRESLAQQIFPVYIAMAHMYGRYCINLHMYVR